MKKNNFKKIFVVFSLCVFLLSLFSISSFALNISDVSTGYLYKFSGSLTVADTSVNSSLNVNGYLVEKSTGNMIPFTSLTYYATMEPGSSGSSSYSYYLNAVTSDGEKQNISSASSSYNVYIDYSNTSISQSVVESTFSQYWNYTVKSVSLVPSFFNKVSLALSGGTNSNGDTYDGFLGMISKFAKFLVSSPLLLVLCIALPLVSFSVGLIIRIKNRA